MSQHRQGCGAVLAPLVTPRARQAQAAADPGEASRDQPGALAPAQGSPTLGLGLGHFHHTQQLSWELSWALECAESSVLCSGSLDGDRISSDMALGKVIPRLALHVILSHFYHLSFQIITIISNYSNIYSNYPIYSIYSNYSSPCRNSAAHKICPWWLPSVLLFFIPSSILSPFAGLLMKSTEQIYP